MSEVCSHGVPFESGHEFRPSETSPISCDLCGVDEECHRTPPPKHLVPDEPPPHNHTRETLHRRIADVLRRSCVADAEQLVRLMEQDAARNNDALESAWGVIANASGGDFTKQSDEWVTWARRWFNETFLPTRDGAEIGPPK